MVIEISLKSGLALYALVTDWQVMATGIEGNYTI
jgi:hypothetical protein